MRWAVLFLLWLAGVANAGALHGGFCFSSVGDAAAAWCSDLARSVDSGVSVAMSQAQVTSSAGVANVQRVSFASGGYCSSAPSVSGQSATMTVSVSGYSALAPFQTVAGTGNAYPGSVSVSGAYVLNGTLSRTVAFPSCAVSQFTSATVEDGVEAGFLAGGALVVVAAVLFLGRRVLT